MFYVGATQNDLSAFIYEMSSIRLSHRVSGPVTRDFYPCLWCRAQYLPLTFVRYCRLFHVDAWDLLVRLHHLDLPNHQLSP